MSLGIRLMRNGINTGFWCSKTTTACYSRTTMTPVVWDVTWKSKISQLQMLLLLLLILFLLLLQLSCVVRFIATLVTLRPFHALCKATFRTFVAQHCDVEVSEGTLYGQTKERDFTFMERTSPRVFAPEAGTSGFAQCTHYPLMVKIRNFTVYICDSQIGNRSSLDSKCTVAHHAAQ
jgi:hypothetical protein